MKKHDSNPPKRHHIRPEWYLKGFSIPTNENCCHSLKVDTGYPLCNTNVSKLANVVKMILQLF